MAAVPDPVAGTPLEITFLDVGQADAALIQTPEGHHVLIDAGRSSPVPALLALDVDTLDLVVASHAHADHIGGLAAVVGAFPVREVVDNGIPATSQVYANTMSAIERNAAIVYSTATPGTFQFGETTIEDEQNDRSVALVVRYGAFAALFSGDSEFRQLNFLADEGVVPDVDLLKAPHHGSSDGVSRRFLAAAMPEVVVVSSGARNSYGHPGPEALRAFSETALVYRTDVNGTIVVRAYSNGAHQVLRDEPSGGRW